MTERYAAGEVDRLLDGLVRGVESVEGGVVLSHDGLVLASAGLGRENSEHLSALVAGFQGLVRGACSRFDGGEPLQSMIEMDRVFLFMVAAGADTCLAALSRTDGDAGTVVYEMTGLAERLAELLPADPRLPGPGVG